RSCSNPKRASHPSPCLKKKKNGENEQFVGELSIHSKESAAQGYKMDDLLTSYISQMLTTMTKQRTSRGNSK
ncbi:hypothetical protein ATANTOWER_009177, partial [Ataeniobius toweri]|nr:hypothetical protein [Ataeniobius toweri]